MDATLEFELQSPLIFLEIFFKKKKMMIHFLLFLIFLIHLRLIVASIGVSCILNIKNATRKKKKKPSGTVISVFFGNVPARICDSRYKKLDKKLLRMTTNKTNLKHVKQLR